MANHASSKKPSTANAVAPANEQVDDKVSNNAQAAAGAAVSRMAEDDYKALQGCAERNEVGSFTSLCQRMSASDREQVKGDFIRDHKFDSLPIAMQTALSPDSPYHQESLIDNDGGIFCTTAVRIEGVTVDQALAALTQTNWKDWWATSSTSGPPPTFDFVPEAPLGYIPGFHLNVQMGDAQKDGSGYRLPAKLDGTFAGPAEMRIEAVDGGVVVHDTWMGMKLSNFTMEHTGGAAFWTNGHLQALRGQMAGGLLGSTGFAGLRKYLLARKDPA